MEELNENLTTVDEDLNETTSTTLQGYFSTENSTNGWGLNVTTNATLQTHHFPTQMLGFTAACAFTIAIFGTFGNLLTIFALPMYRKLRTTATAFVINLAVVELMFCVFILPISGAQYAYLQYHTESLISDRACVFFVFARYTFTQVELQTIVAIALTRAIAVGFPTFYRKIDNKYVTGVYIAIIWIVSFFIRLPTGLGIFGKYIFNPKTMECDMGRDAGSKKARSIMIMGEGIVPTLIILVLYIFIFVMLMRRCCIRSRKFRKPSTISNASFSTASITSFTSNVKLSSRRVARAGGKTQKSPSTSTSGVSVTDDPSTGETSGRKPSLTSFKNLKRMVSDSSLKSRLSRRPSNTCTSRRDMRVARTIFIIFMMVNICSLPVAMIHLVDPEARQPRRFLALHILYWLQYCLNLIVYVLMNRQYREAYVAFVAKIMPSWERHKDFVFPWETPSISSRPPQTLNNSIKGRKDSYSQDPSAAPKEYKPMEPSVSQRQGRLSAIIEVNSSSVVSNDDVFVQDQNTAPKIDKNDINTNQTPKEEEKRASSTFKDHSEKGSPEEKEHWITQNGETVHSPTEEHKV